MWSTRALGLRGNGEGAEAGDEGVYRTGRFLQVMKEFACVQANVRRANALMRGCRSGKVNVVFVNFMAMYTSVCVCLCAFV